MFEVHVKKGRNGNYYWGMFEVSRNDFGDIFGQRWQFGCGPMGHETDQEAFQEVRSCIAGSIPIYDSEGNRM